MSLRSCWDVIKAVSKKAYLLSVAYVHRASFMKCEPNKIHRESFGNAFAQIMLDL